MEAQLERQVFVPAADAQLHIVGRVQPQGARVLARFELRRGHVVAGSRELLAVDCAELRRALPIVIALAVDVEAQSVRLVLPPPPAVDTTRPTPRPVEASRITDVSHPPPVSFGLRTGAALDIGLLPTSTYSARVALRFEARRGPPLELRAAFLFPALSLHEGRGVQTWGGLASLAACPRLVRANAPWLLEACAGVDGGAVVVRGQGFTVNRQATSALFDAFAGLRIGVQFSHLAFSLEAAITVPLPATRFTVTSFDGSESAVATGQPIAGRLELAIATVP